MSADLIHLAKGFLIVIVKNEKTHVIYELYVNF